jgi:hypothetical protein
MDDAGSDGGDSTLLLAQMREAYGRAAYTHKTHEKQADICYRKHISQQRLLLALTAISSGAFLASLFGLVLSKEWGSLATSFIAVLVSAITLATKNFKHGEETQQHRDVAAKLWNIRESYQSLVVDLQSGECSSADGRARRDQLQEQYAAILSEAPRTTAKAYAAAQDGLKNRQDLTFSDDEIDALLPAALRKGKGGGHEDK